MQLILRQRQSTVAARDGAHAALQRWAEVRRSSLGGGADIDGARANVAIPVVVDKAGLDDSRLNLAQEGQAAAVAFANGGRRCIACTTFASHALPTMLNSSLVACSG